MKPDRKSEARAMLSARIFPLLENLLQLGEADAIERRNGKGVRPQANAFQIRLGAGHTRPLYLAALGFVCDYPRCRFIDFKLRAHFLDLRGLLFYHCRKTINGAFQFRDPLLLFQRFIDHGLGLERHSSSIDVDGHRA